MRIIGTVEARMGSTRLPGKTLSKIYSGMHLLECVVRRFRQCKNIDDVVVATTVETSDDLIFNWCEENGVSVYRGPEDDVLDRVVKAAEHYSADAIVQMGADSAYLDYELIDEMVDYYNRGLFDYVCNDLTLTYPLGIYAHVVKVDTLAAVNQKNNLSEEDRVDVVRFIWENPERFNNVNIEAPDKCCFPELRLTIDYPEDLEQAIDIYAHFDSPFFTTAQIIELYKSKPDLFARTLGLVQESAPFLSSAT